MKNNIETETKLSNAVSYLLIGGTIGAVIALLLAPRRGSELRSQIADATRDGYDATVEIADDLKARSTELMGDVKEKAAAVYDLASNKLTTGVDGVEEVINSTSTAVKDGLDRLRNESPRQNKPLNKDTPENQKA